jgi:hypothetical protein
MFVHKLLCSVCQFWLLYPMTGNLKAGFFSVLSTLINTTSSATPQIPLFQRMLRLNLGLLRLWHWQSDTVTTRLDLIHKRIYLIYDWLNLIHDRLNLIHGRLDLFHGRLDLIHDRLDLIHGRPLISSLIGYHIHYRLDLIQDFFSCCGTSF